jgi:hypothetical protein
VDSLLFSRAVFIFLSFSNIFNFSDFCRICYFKFLNSVLTNNLEMDSSFFLKYLKNFKILKISYLIGQFLKNRFLQFS